MTKLRWLLVVALVLLAQSVTAQTSHLRGQVTDSDGAPLPGVTVTVSGDALIQGMRTIRTSGSGTYSFNALPPGDYSIRTELDSYQTRVIEGVRAKLNITTTVNFEMSSNFTEELLVTGEVPMVDLTSSSVGANFGDEFIDQLPLARNHWDLMVVSPGVTVNFESSSSAVIAFGSGVTNHAWNIDGLASDAPFLGSSWWYLNPDTIEEVQVLGVGASAEFGNMLGTAFNVVTKSGGNDLSGSFNIFSQVDALTDANVTLEGSPFPQFERDRFLDATGVLGGPIKKDKAWYFLAAQSQRDGSTEPGADPAFVAENSADRFDAKFNFQLTTGNSLDFKLHTEEWNEPGQSSLAQAPSAQPDWQGENPAAALSFNSVLSSDTFLEVRAGGWWGDSLNPSVTGSNEPTLFDFSPQSTGDLAIVNTGVPVDVTVFQPPTAVSQFQFGGPIYPTDFVNWRAQVDVVASHFADDLAGDDHDFKFGITVSTAETGGDFSAGPNGAYYGSYVAGDTRLFYKYNLYPYEYGAEVDSFSAFVNDSWHVNDKLTLNLGLRWDAHDGVIPSYEELDSDFNGTGTFRSGADVVDWSNIAPRFGFAFNPDQRTVLRGAAGIYYDDVVTGNWDIPSPDSPPFEKFTFNPETGAFDIRNFAFSSPNVAFDPDLKAPKAYQYTLGFERQLRTDMSFGAQLVYKKTEDLIGWEILDDGVYEEVPWTNPFTGEQETLLSVVEFPSIRKGNQPGFTVLGPDTEYEQTYRGLILTYNKRHSDGWALNASYTWSESEGLVPRHLSAFQNNALLGNRNGTDPNQWLNADQLLQGDREHMFRVQATFDLPYGLLATTVVNFQSGQPYNTQTRVAAGTLRQGRVRVVAVPGNDDQRFPFQSLIDFAIGKRFQVGGVTVKLDAQAFNILNDDAIDRWATLILNTPQQDFVPRFYLKPRRVMLRLGVQF